MNFYPKFGAPHRIEEEQSQQSNLPDSSKRRNGRADGDSGDQDYTDYMKIKLNDTSDNEGDHYNG